MILNNDVFEIFKYSNDKKKLKEALSWIDKALSFEERPVPNEMDTKANLLCKFGRRSEALLSKRKPKIK
jgi:hypothetical protein